MALVITFVGTWPPPLKEVAGRALAALQVELGQTAPTATVNIKLVDDAEIASLNRQYTGNAGATDVLTFAYGETSSIPEAELADIAISTQMAVRQAQEAGSELTDEIGLLVTHGLLHALGYDHATATDRQQFDGRQRRILELANIAYRDFQWKD